MAKTLTEIPSLPRQTGTLNAFTFDLVHKVILAQGKKKGPGYVFQDGIQKFFAPGELNCVAPSFAVRDTESQIFRCYLHSGFEDDPEASESFQESISIAVHTNLFLFLLGHIPEKFHDQMSKEIDIQGDYFSAEKRHEIMEEVKEEIREFRQEKDGAK